MKPIIELKNITKIYPYKPLSFFDLRTIKYYFSRRVTEGKIVLNNLNLSVYEGEIVGIFGPNGSGKTTLCKLISNLLKPDKGEIIIFGKKISSDNDYRKIARYIFPYISDILNVYTFFKLRLNVYDNLLYLSSFWLSDFDDDDIKDRIEHALDLLNIRQIKNEWVQRLSRGTMQKLVFALAYTIKPKILILDEPFIYIDKNSLEIIIDYIIRELHYSGSTFLITSHNLSLLKVICKRILFICNGKLKEINFELEGDPLCLK